MRTLATHKGTNIVWFPLHEVPRAVRVTETERIVGAGGGGEWGGECSAGQRFSSGR